MQNKNTITNNCVPSTGPFPRVKGSRIQHDKLLAFIERNYAHDDAGCWFFQNGPQRVYVQLEAAPYVWRIGAAPPWPVTAHTGEEAQVHGAWLDEHGRLFLHADLGFGIVHTLDMGPAADAVEEGHWRPEAAHFDELPGRFGYRLMPTPAPPGHATEP